MPTVSDQPSIESKDAKNRRIIMGIAVAGIAAIGIHWAAMTYGATVHDANCPLHGVAQAR